MRRLSQMPERGHIPPELARTDSFEYRQIIVKPYRIFYQVVESGVFICGLLIQIDFSISPQTIQATIIKSS